VRLNGHDRQSTLLTEGRNLLAYAKDVFVRAIKGYSADGCGQKAAAISYFGLLSLFPLVLFAISFIGIVAPQSSLRERVVDIVLNNIPLGQAGPNDVGTALRDVSGVESDAVGVFGILALVWAASGLFGSLRAALSDIFNPTSNAPLLVRKALDLAMVLGVALLFLASLGITALLRYAASNEDHVPILGMLARDSSFLVAPVRLLLPGVISFGAFFVIYWLVPASGDRRRNDFALGALVAAVLFEVVKHGFTFYLAHFTNYALIFGPIGAIIAFLVWLYLSANILLYGAEVAVAVDLERSRRASPLILPPKPPGTPTGAKKAVLDIRNAFIKRTPRRQRQRL
jgi:membrane protein